jgi:hypothetical protein
VFAAVEECVECDALNGVGCVVGQSTRGRYHSDGADEDPS